MSTIVGATYSGIVPTSSSNSTNNEDAFSNPFYESLRRDFEHMLIANVRREPSAIIAIPSLSATESIPKSILYSKKFAEAHILNSAHMPGLLCSVRGNPVEFRNDRLTVTLAGDPSGGRLTAKVIQAENVFDFGYSFRVLIVDKPLDRVLSGKDGEEGDKAASSGTRGEDGSPRSGGGPSEYLSAVPLVEADFFEKLLKLRRTYLLVKGHEAHLAGRIKDMSVIAANQAVRYMPNPPSVQVVQADVERSAYASLHAWIYPMIASWVDPRRYSDNTKDKTQIHIECMLREMRAPEKVIACLPSLIAAIQADVTPLLHKLALGVTPQQKLHHMVSVSDRLGSIVSRALHVAETGADELLACLTIALMLGNSSSAPVDVAYAELFLSCHPELSGSKAAFTVATLSSCIDFLSRAIV